MEKVVLVIDYSVDWTKVFRGSGVRVEQTEWRHLDLRVENAVLIADILENPLAFTRAAQQQRSLSHIDAVLVRNFPLGLRGDRFGSLCNALMISRVKCVNGALCVLATTDRAWLYAELLGVQEELGRDAFPLVQLNFFSNMLGHGRGFEPLKRADNEVTVIKVGSTNAGFGKSLVKSNAQRDDLWSILSCTKEYVTEEPFIEHEFEYRLQVIGDHLRCFRRSSDSTWKNNTGNLQFSDMKVEDRHKTWAAACRKMFGGSNLIFALDILRRADGSETIIEINPTANGLMYDHEEEDCKRIRDLVLAQLK